MFQNDIPPFLRLLILGQFSVEVKKADVHRGDAVHRPLPLAELQLRDIDVPLRKFRACFQPLQGADNLASTTPFMRPASGPVRQGKAYPIIACRVDGSNIFEPIFGDDPFVICVCGVLATGSGIRQKVLRCLPASLYSL